MNFPEMIKDISPQIRDTQQIPSKINFLKIDLHLGLHSKTAEPPGQRDL